jgi:hypothetical protein
MQGKPTLPALLALAFTLAAPAALALIDLDAKTGARTYAAELVSNGTKIPDDNLDVQHKLGFGIVANRAEYFRYDLINATFNASVGSLPLVFNQAGGTSSPIEVVVSGGGAGSNSVVIQVVSNSAYDANSLVHFNLGSGNANGIGVVDHTQPASLRYRRYSSTTAANSGGTNSLYDVQGVLANTAPALLFTDTAYGHNTPTIAQDYKDFDVLESVGATLAEVGRISVGVTPGTYTTVGNPVALSDLIATGTKVVVGGLDFSPLTTGSGALGLYMPKAAACSGGAAFTSSSVDATHRQLVIDPTKPFTDTGICYQVNGTTAIKEQPFSVSLVVTPAAGAATQSVNGLGLGLFERDGVVLKFPYIATQSGSTTLIQLVNRGTRSPPITILCYSDTAAVSNGATTFTLPAGTTLGIGFAKLGCPATTTSVQMQMDAVRGSVVGTMVRVNNTTGEIGIDAAVGNNPKH